MPAHKRELETESDVEEAQIIALITENHKRRKIELEGVDFVSEGGEGVGIEGQGRFLSAAHQQRLTFFRYIQTWM
jgi:hypothetical protein